MLGFHPSALLLLLGGISLHRYGVEAGSPLDVLANALNELTRVVSIPLSAVTGWSLMEADPNFESETQLLEPQEGRASLDRNKADATVSAVVHAAAQQAREKLEAISDVASSVYDSVEWKRHDTEHAVSEAPPEAELARKAEGKSHGGGEWEESATVESINEGHGPTEGFGSQLQDVIMGAGEKVDSAVGAPEAKETQESQDNVADGLGKVASEVKEEVETQETNDLSSEAEAVVNDAIASVAVLLLDTREKIEAAKASGEPKPATEAIQDVTAKFGEVFSEARLKLETAKDSAEQKHEAEQVLKATETNVAEILAEAKNEVEATEEDYAEPEKEVQESADNAETEVGYLVSRFNEGEATNESAADTYGDGEKSMEDAAAEIEKAFLRVRED